MRQTCSPVSENMFSM